MLVAKDVKYEELCIIVINDNEYTYVLHKLDQLGYKWNSGDDLITLNIQTRLDHQNVLHTFENGVVKKSSKFFLETNRPWLNLISIKEFIKSNFEHSNG